MDGSQLVGPAGPEAGVSAPARRRPWPLRQLAIALGVLVALVGLGDYGRYYWTTGRFLVSTEDATVQADSVIVSPRVSGYIAAVLVQDNEPVRAGQVLARIDDRDDRAARAEARADLAAATAGIDNLRQEITRQRLVVTQARAGVAADQAALAFSRQQDGRYARLARTGAGTQQLSQQWQADITEKQAALARDTAGVGVAVQQIAVLRTALARAQATYAQRQAALRQADLNARLHHHHRARHGTVGDRTLRVGQYVQAGTALMAVVPLAAVYVTANYKETQLTDVPSRPAGHDRGRHVPRRHRAWRRQQHRPGQRRGVRAAAARQRHRQLHQDRAAHPGEDHASIRTIRSSAGCVRACRSSRRSIRVRTHDRRLTWPTSPLQGNRPSRCDLDRRRRRHHRRLHGGAEHPDHQRLPALYRGRHRHRRRQRRLGDHRLPDRRDHRHPDDRFPQPGVLAAPLPDRQHGAVPAVLRCLRPGAHPAAR